MVVCDNSCNFALGNQKEQYLMTENINLKYQDEYRIQLEGAAISSEDPRVKDFRSNRSYLQIGHKGKKELVFHR